MRSVRFFITLLLVMAIAVTAVFPQVLCIQADGSRSVELAAAGCCISSTHEAAQALGMESGISSPCTDIPLANAAAARDFHGRAWNLLLHAIVQIPSCLLPPLTLPAARPALHHAPPWSPSDGILEAHRTVVLTV